MSRLRAELRARINVGWSRERLEAWLDAHQGDGYTDEEIELGRLLLAHHEAYRARRYKP